jgi:hypothetical protein
MRSIGRIEIRGRPRSLIQNGVLKCETRELGEIRLVQQSSKTTRVVNENMQ